MNTVAFAKRALGRHKPAKLLVSFKEREKAKSKFFNHLQREQFGNEMKSLKVEKEIPKGGEILRFSPVIDEAEFVNAKSGLD